MAKMSVEQLWSFLSEGVDQLRDPTLDERAPLTEEDCDTIIEEGRIVGNEMEEGEMEEEKLENDGEDVGSSSMWHEERAAQMQQLEEEDKMAEVCLSCPCFKFVRA